MHRIRFWKERRFCLKFGVLPGIHQIPSHKESEQFLELYNMNMYQIASYITISQLHW